MTLKVINATGTV